MPSHLTASTASTSARASGRWQAVLHTTEAAGPPPQDGGALPPLRWRETTLRLFLARESGKLPPRDSSAGAGSDRAGALGSPPRRWRCARSVLLASRHSPHGGSG